MTASMDPTLVDDAISHLMRDHFLNQGCATELAEEAMLVTRSALVDHPNAGVLEMFLVADSTSAAHICCKPTVPPYGHWLCQIDVLLLRQVIKNGCQPVFLSADAM